jgi:hypothetical protein
MRGWSESVAVRAAATWLAVSLLAFGVTFAISAASADGPAEAVEPTAPTAETAVVLETEGDTEPVPQLRSAPSLAPLLPPPRKRPAPQRAAPAPRPEPPASTPSPEPEPEPAPNYSPPPSSPAPAPQPTAQPAPPPETFDSVGEEFDSPG